MMMGYSFHLFSFLLSKKARYSDAPYISRSKYVVGSIGHLNSAEFSFQMAFSPEGDCAFFRVKEVPLLSPRAKQSKKRRGPIPTNSSKHTRSNGELSASVSARTSESEYNSTDLLLG